MAQDRPHELVTRDADSMCGYFSLTIDEFGCVSKITCITENCEIYFEELSNLHGFPASYLNRVWERFSEDLIADFFEHFAEPWASALYQDRFGVVRQDVEKGLAMLSLLTYEEVLGTIKNELDDNNNVCDEKQRKLLGKLTSKDVVAHIYLMMFS
eukprot:Clim_evm29s239 gene=Clim_evmTU29s239